MFQSLTLATTLLLAVFVFGVLLVIIKMYRKAIQGEAMVRTGMGDTKVSFSGIFVVPIIHKLEVMDITLKTIVIARTGAEGLICKDNLRADIKVNFFLRVNKTQEDVVQVAQSIGCKRASDPGALEGLFDAKFSEALKTVGKHFDFVELYQSRDDFKRQILQTIGTDLNGYVLDDCAIDYLEQTPLTQLNENNILDAEGIKKIIDLTARQKVQANLIEREREKTIKKQNVEAQETILELEKQLAENEEKQRREIASIKSREAAEIEKVRQEQRMISERARIATDEEVMISEQNRERQVLVAERSKQRTDAVETVRVEQAKMLEENEMQRIVALAQIEKEKAIEEERKNIQGIIRERITVEKAVVEEEEKIKDTKAFAEAERLKSVAITTATMVAEEALVKEIKGAEAARQAAEFKAQQLLIDAEAEKTSSVNRAQAIKMMAEAEATQAAAKGLSEAQVMEAKAAARQKEGEAEANVTERQAIATAKATRVQAEAQAEADERLGLVAAKVTQEKGMADASIVANMAAAEESRGLAEARVSGEKFSVEAKGIEEKADAMKKLDGVGKEHEEFKLRLEKDKAIELAQIDIQKDIAASQAAVLAEALKAAKIDIVGGETMFFDQIVHSITKGKQVDRLVTNSEVLGTMKDTFFQKGSNGHVDFKANLQRFMHQFNMNSEDVRNLSVSALLLKMMQQKTLDEDTTNTLRELTSTASALGLGDKPVYTLN
ncbi:flotillin family protein [Rufibacter glacialis]|uniref:Flotillin family protein n=1 Tax=Rufibacter glacialis TaxID=1259555 RepID=A0A5M8Q7C4_9BACT|nr:flotillin family protein [Rufibacter glacialis]KAA6430776.1 flotillin family protein [Rufibacter glacialis]GGK86640.1 flotillin family protein [Rufibacter glacialis]